MKKSSKTFKVSDPSNNVYGFSVVSSGIKLTSFLENPVCLLNHNYDKVMGSWADVLLIGNNLQGVPVFDTEDPEANRYYGQVERDVIKGASIGIIPLSVEGDVVTSCDLLEISITPVPANRNSLIMYNKAGLVLNSAEARTYLLSIASNEVLHSSNQIENLIDKAITLNVLPKSSRQGWLNLAAKDTETAYSILSDLTRSSVHASLIKSVEPLQNASYILTSRNNWSFDDYAKRDPIALAAMQDNNPDEFMRLYSFKVKELRSTGLIAL